MGWYVYQIPATLWWDPTAGGDAWLGAKVSLVRLKSQEHAEAAGASSVRQLVRKKEQANTGRVTPAGKVVGGSCYCSMLFSSPPQKLSERGLVSG